MKKMKQQTNLPVQVWNHLDKMNPLEFLDYASVLIFALTGAVTASHAQLDLIGFTFLASLTAVGRGSILDLMQDRKPIF